MIFVLHTLKATQHEKYFLPLPTIFQSMNNDLIKIQSPGRICLFGDHQDYLGLPVIACAIDRYIQMTATPNDKSYFDINLVDIGKKRRIAIDDLFPVLNKRDYFASALRVLRRENCIPDKGYGVHITGNIPINSGTSSSSALLIGWIKFLIAAFGIDDEINAARIAYLGYAAEVLEHREPGGMMDHYSIAVGNIVHITTETPFICKQIGKDLAGIITGVSGVKKDTVGLIAHLKQNTFKALEIIKSQHANFVLSALKPSDIAHYEACLPENLKRFFQAAVLNHHYTQEALLEFDKPNPSLKILGDLMNGHHQVLRDLLGVTVPKIDRMIKASLEAGAYGAKIVGSGGGGSIVVIAPKERVQAVCEAIKKVGAKDAYPVAVSRGTFRE